MSFQPGYKAYLAFDNAAGTPVNLSPYIDDTSMQVSTEMLDVSTIGTSTKNMLPGLIGGDTVPLSGPYDVTVHTQLSAARSAGSLLGFIYGPGGSVASQARFAGSVYVSNYTVTSTVGGRVEYAASLQVTGAVSASTF